MKTFMRISILIIVLLLTMPAYSAATNEFINIPNITNREEAKAVELVKAYYSALNKKDMRALFVIMSPDVIHDINQGGSEKGLEKFKIFMNKSNQSFNEKINNIIIMVSNDGKHAAAKWVDHGVYFKDFPGLNVSANNQTYTLPGGHFFEISNGKFTRISTYYNETDFMNQIK